MNKKVLYKKYKDRATFRLVKLKETLLKQAKQNKWDIPLAVVVIEDILKERENVHE